MYVVRSAIASVLDDLDLSLNKSKLRTRKLATSLLDAVVAKMK